MGRAAHLFFLWAILVGVAGQALADNREDVPPALAPWRAFALYGAGEKLCPPDGNTANARICRFETSLTLDLDGSGANFTLRARLFDDGFIALPAGAGVWIEGVREKGGLLPVVAGEAGPVVWLPPGEHVLEGRLGWSVAPATLALPPDIGLVRLTRQGVEARVAISPTGELRLAPGAAAKPIENREIVKVFRLIADGVPVTVTTVFRLEVSGLARTITLAGAVPEGTVPLAVRGPVPATFGPGGALVLDAGPGRYDVEVVTRFPGKVDRIGPAACPYGREIWSFAAAGDVREVRPEGLPGIDPKTAEVPVAWRGFPAFAVMPGTALTLVELGRGAPAGRDALTLNREMWLDFSGQGLSVRDTLAGENRKTWTLRLLPPGELGRLTIAGQDQPVVRLGPEGTPGVELRRSALQLVARSRYPDARALLPAGGFDREFERVSATLNLPPGWELLWASGPDTVTGGFFSNWTLLDVFLVFLLAVAVVSLRGPAAGVTLGIFLLLSWHEPNAPAVAWIFVLAGLGLLRVAGDPGRLAGWSVFRRMAVAFFGLSVLALIVLAIPFVARELRLAVAPQIESGTPFSGQALQLAAKPEAMPAPAVAPRAMRKAETPGNALDVAVTGAAADASRLEFDPDALIQTGPATPTWSGRAVSLQWRGPVVVGQSLHLILASPLATLLLRLARVLFLGLALFFLFDRDRLRRVAGPAAVLLGLLLVGATMPTPSPAADFPPVPLLDLWRDRLTEPARCFPHCLGSPGLDVRLEGGRLVVAYAVDAAARTVAPLPVVSDNWRPESVLLDGASAGELVRQGAMLQVLVEAGHHVIVLAGAAPEAVSFTLAAPLAPGRVRVFAPGYRTRGLDGRGALTGPLELTRAAETPSGVARPTGSGAEVPAFFAVERALDFGLTFEVATQVVRRSPLVTAAVVAVPLLPGERPDALGVTIRGEEAVVAFAPGQSRVAWRSQLPAVPQLRLVASPGDTLVETWSISAAPFYDLVFEGIPPVARLTPDGRLQPRFAPWPGEALAVRITRPEVAPGEYLTLERAELVARQGGQVRDVTLTMAFRAAKGARHVVKLPAGVEVTRLTVAGRETLATGGPGEAGFALPPGVTEVVLQFREQAPLGVFTRTPVVDLGLPGANIQARLELPAERWLLAVRGATPLGPAVLYWGWLATVVVVGLGLSTLRDTPLSRWQWFGYALGLSQATPGNFVLAVAWLAALGVRRRHPVTGSAAGFNLVQIGLVLLALAGLAALYETLGAGLLGLPRMQVTGGGSTATSLAWTFDRVAGPVPSCLAVTVPLLVFRGLMLLWAIWLAQALVRWLRWGFVCLTEGGGWRKVSVVLRRAVRAGGQAGGPGRPEGDDRGPQKP